MASDVRSAARDVAVVLAVSVLVGVALALLWHWWWAPAPEGFVYQRAPFFGPDEEFRSTGTYVALAAPAGVLLGSVVTWLRDSDEVVTLVAVLVGSLLAGGVMLAVGHALGPDTATTVAAGLADGAAVDADLRVQPGPAWLAFPVGALVGCTVVLLTFPNVD